MTFNDIFKNSFLESMNAVSPADICLALIMAFAMGMFIYFIYQRTYRGVMYSSGFGITLVALTMITTVIILAISSNVVLSLGMVGALSIVRFRTAIKEPMDIAFLFWAIAMGIVIGAGMIPLAVLGSVVIGLVLVVFVTRQTGSQPYILVIQCDGAASEQKVTEYVKSHTKRSVTKSKTARKEGVEVNLEVRLAEDNTDFVNEVAAMEGVYHAVLVSYNGDYMN